MANNTSLLETFPTLTTVGTRLPPYQYPEFGEIWPDWGLQICLYSLILFLSILGNSLVIVTLIQNTKMRTVTNVYLLNLSIADLLCGVFCMPFTLVGSILQNFIFGNFMCKVVAYLQGEYALTCFACACLVYVNSSFSLHFHISLCMQVVSI